uniref:Protein TIC 214 n=1 Tax=Vaginularia trichoidea TaxID=474354 RepID=A0A3G5CTE8_9MONI|nr:Hypothetical Protein [Vaginularia trichoidea]AYW16132.1 Hypothetical Protein [Vaginularia trichoidea]
MQFPFLNYVDSYILIALFYGILTTLPVGIPQILSIRAFLLGGNLIGTISMGGSLLAQIITILSIYYSPIYLLVLRPHAFTLVIIPYLLLFCLIIKDPPKYRKFRLAVSIRDKRLVKFFLLSFFFQILNPIMLPNPVLTRLIYLNLFRYSDNKIFVITSFFGWFVGQCIFTFLARLLVTSIEKDSPILYLITKRFISVTFSIVLISNTLAYLGRAPVSLWTNKFLGEADDLEMSFWNIAEYPDLLCWFFKPWPTSFFDPTRLNRGNRFIKNNQTDNYSSFYKRRMSTYFFGESVTDGRQRLNFASLPSLVIFKTWMDKSMAKNIRCFQFKNWVSIKLEKTKEFQERLTIQLKQLDTGSIFSKTMSLRSRLIKNIDSKIPRNYDPFINNYRIRVPVAQTFLSTTELAMTPWEWTEFKAKREIALMEMKDTFLTNNVKNWIDSKKMNWNSREPSLFLLPWEPLPLRSLRVFKFLFRDRVSYDQDVQNILRKLRYSFNGNILWEEIINLESEDQLLFLTYLKHGSCYQKNWLFPFSKTNRILLSKLRSKIYKLQKMEELSLNLTRNIAIYIDSPLDIPGLDGDFRNRRLRNVGLVSSSIKGKSKLLRIVHRYANISDFRRKLFKGSMRSRRRKTFVWDIFQNKIHSPFFLRSAQESFLRKTPHEHLTTSKINLRFEKQLVTIIAPSATQRKDLTKNKKGVRSPVAIRSDIGSIHNGRGYMLILQSKVRKYIKIPILLILKNLGRTLFHQKSEWEKDWRNWKRETYIYCTFDGEEFSQKDLPPRWLREGLQIKIVYPFHLKLWHTSKIRRQRTLQKRCFKLLYKNSKLTTKKNRESKRPKFTYLTVLGYQTDVPFGTIQRESSFWKPLIKRFILKTTKARKPALRSQRSKKTQMDSDSKRTDWSIEILTNEIDRLKKLRKDIIEKSNLSISIGGEFQPVHVIKEKLVSQDQFKKVIKNGLDNDTPIYSINLPDGMIETKELDLQKTLDLNILISDEDRIHFQKHESNQSVEIEKILVGFSYLFCKGLLDNSILITTNNFYTIKKILSAWFNEFNGFFIQLQSLFHDLRWENEILRRNLVARLSLLSQANLYAGVWDIGMIGYLNLDLLSRDDNYKHRDSSSNLQTSQKDRKKTIYHISYDLSAITEYNNKSFTTKKTNKPTERCISENITTYIRRSGFLTKFENLNENKWNGWLHYLVRYNLQLSLWRNIAPRQWKLKKSKLNTNNSKYQLSQNQINSYSIYSRKPFLKYRVGNVIRLHKQRKVLHTLTDFVQNGDIHSFSTQQINIEQKIQNHIKRSRKGFREKIIKIFISSRNSYKRRMSNSYFDFLCSRDLNLTRTNSFLNFKHKTDHLKHPLLRDNYKSELVLDINNRFQKVVNELQEIILEEREDADMLFQWKWKSEAESDRIKQFIALAKILGDEHDLVTLCVNTNVNPGFFNCYLAITNKFELIDKFCFIFGDRISTLFDDQDLLFKILHSILQFKFRFKFETIRDLNKYKSTTNYLSDILCSLTNWNCQKCHIYNIDDIFLPRRRWEFRFLNCFLLSRNLDKAIDLPNQTVSKIVNIYTQNKSLIDEALIPNRIQKIKRFLWPSFRLEQIASIGRFSLNITDGNQFAALRIRLYLPS